MNYLSHNLPLSFDNALTLEGVIHKIIKKIENIEEKYSNIKNDFNGYTNEQIKLVKEQLDGVKNELENSITKLGNTLKVDININTEHISELNSKLLLIDNELDKINARVDSTFSLIENNYKSLILLINQVKDYVDKVIKEMTVKVYSPVNGKYMNIQDCLVQMMNLYQIDFGNITLGYLKKIFTQTLIFNEGDVTINIVDIKFSILKDLPTGLSYFTITHNTKKNNYSVHLDFKSSHKYSLYQIIALIGRGINRFYPNINTTDVYNHIGDMLYFCFGWDYMSILKNDAFR